MQRHVLAGISLFGMVVVWCSWSGVFAIPQVVVRDAPPGTGPVVRLPDASTRVDAVTAYREPVQWNPAPSRPDAATRYQTGVVLNPAPVRPDAATAYRQPVTFLVPDAAVR